MRESTYVIGLIAGLVLLVAAEAWLRVLRDPNISLRKPEGEESASAARAASCLLALALGVIGVTAIAAVLALVLKLLNVFFS